MPIIYAAINKINDKMYIGKSVNDLSIRMRKHLELYTKKGKNKTYFQNALFKYGKDGFDWIILEETTKDMLDDAEKFWISYYKYIGACLYNLTNGGDGLLGYKHTDLTKHKIAESLRGIKHTDIRNNNVANALAKTYSFIDSNNNRITIKNLTRFCRNHNYDVGSMIKVSKGKRTSAYGYKQYNGKD